MSIMQCETCGRPTEQQFLCPDGDMWHILCPNCASQLNTCAFCKKVNTCSFETDPSPLPKMIQKEFRQGPMITVTEIMNPERQKITCQNGCLCYSEEWGCMRQFHWCKNMDYVWSNESNESQ